MPSRPCVRCKRIIPSGSLCDRCQERRDEQRAVLEPWRTLYHTAEYQAAQRACLRRDGQRCRALTPAGQCSEARRLQAHHTTQLRDLWAQAQGDWDLFVTLATDTRHLVSLCPRHHWQADRALRGVG